MPIKETFTEKLYKAVTVNDYVFANDTINFIPRNASHNFATTGRSVQRKVIAMLSVGEYFDLQEKFGKYNAGVNDQGDKPNEAKWVKFIKANVGQFAKGGINFNQCKQTGNSEYFIVLERRRGLKRTRTQIFPFHKNSGTFSKEQHE